MSSGLLKQIKLQYLCAILLISLFAAIPISAQIDFGGDSDSEPIVTMQSMFSRSEAEVGKIYDAALIVKIMKHWHINSITPNQDFLIPAKLGVGNSNDYTI